MIYYIKVKEKVIVDRLIEYKVNANSEDEAIKLLTNFPSDFEGELIKEFDADDQGKLVDSYKFDIIQISKEDE